MLALEEENRRDDLHVLKNVHNMRDVIFSYTYMYNNIHLTKGDAMRKTIALKNNIKLLLFSHSNVCNNMCKSYIGNKII
jgi:hypothetical protein